jgi:hypothetical protein
MCCAHRIVQQTKIYNNAKRSTHANLRSKHSHTDKKKPGQKRIHMYILLSFSKKIISMYSNKIEMLSEKIEDVLSMFLF